MVVLARRGPGPLISRSGKRASFSMVSNQLLVRDLEKEEGMDANGMREFRGVKVGG
jgi:hypothetical protein